MQRRLLIDSPQFDRLRPLLLDGAGFACGQLRLRELSQVHEWIVQDLRVTREPVNGHALPPFQSYCMFVVGHRDLPADVTDATSLSRRVGPKLSHTLAIVWLESNRTQSCQLWGWQHGRQVTIDELRIVGPGWISLRRLDGVPDQERASSQDTDNAWGSRTRGALRPGTLEKISNIPIALVGAGGTGGLLGFQLATVFRNLRIFDADTIETENLDRMPHVTSRDQGRLKADLLARRLTQFSPRIRIKQLAKSILDADAKHCIDRLESGILISAVDCDAARLAVALMASRVQYSLHMDIGTSIQRTDNGSRTLRGDVRLLAPGAPGQGNGCVQCVGGFEDANQAFYEAFAPVHTLHRGERVLWHQQRAGSLLHWNQIVTGIAMQTLLDFLTDFTKPTALWHRIAWDDPRGLLVDDVGAVSGNADCEVCGAAAAV